MREYFNLLKARLALKSDNFPFLTTFLPILATRYNLFFIAMQLRIVTTALDVPCFSENERRL